MVPEIVTSRSGLDQETLVEVAEACGLTLDQIDDAYSCTPLQSLAMADSAIHSGASIFRFVLSLGLSVDLDRWCLALREVVSLNPVLRTRLVDCRLGLLQVVTNEEHCTQYRPGNIEEYIRDDKEQPLDLGASLFRSALIDRKWVLTMHHAVMDHSSLALLFKDVLRIYNGGTPERHAAFKDFVRYCLTIDEKAATPFWAARFKGNPAIFPKVETGYTPNATEKVTQKILSHRIGAGVSLAHIPSYIETAWALTSATYTGSESVAYGLVLSGRLPALAGLETTLGPTIATIPVQVNVQRSMTVEGMIKERSTSLRQLQAKPALQYGIARIRGVSDASRVAAGFQTLLNIRPSFYDPDESADLKYESMDEPNGSFALCLYFNIQTDGIQVEAMSDPAVLCRSQLRRTVRQFQFTFQSLMEADFHSKLGQLQLLNPSDRSEIFQWNNNIPETTERCIHELFRERARKQPDATAVEAADGSLTYRSLDETSDRLSLELQRRGTSTGDPVPFIFEKSLWTIVAVLGIMKAGGACVPIEKSDPHARKAAIISSVHAKIVVTSSTELTSSAGLAPDIFAVSAESISELTDVTLPVDEKTSSPGDVAYIIFTSGSTGSPKGVLLEHSSLASSLNSLAQRFDWQGGSRMLQFAAHVWDISVGEIFGALLFGGCLCIPSDTARQSNLAEFIEFNKINWAWLTPTVLRIMSPEDVPGLQSLLSIGEPVDAGAAKSWGRALRLFNGWGPCETSILSAVAELGSDSRFPETIGMPIGCGIWIVNAGKPNELCPIGTVGELVVEGPGVARGYLDAKSKSATSFIPSPPWARPRVKTSRNFYRTGDLARYNPDGSICFIGRQDHQVKIRGQRFELRELENVITSCTDVRDIFTTTKISEGRTELVAVVCLVSSQMSKGATLVELSDPYSESTLLRLRTLRDHVISRLPSFMVPSVWLAVEQMPRTASAKLDRTSIKEWLKKKNLTLARAALNTPTTKSMAPLTTPEEVVMQSVWSSVLSLPEHEVGRESSFMQLGGDSILAMQAASRCRKRGLQTTTAELLRGESLTAISRSSIIIESTGDAKLASPEANTEDGRLVGPTATMPGTANTQPAQFNNRPGDQGFERMVPATDVQAFMLAVGHLGDKAYHNQFNLDFRPGINFVRLRMACEKVIRHHTILRTTFIQRGSALYQAVLKDIPVDMVLDSTKEAPQSSIALQEGKTLVRFCIIPDGQTCHRLSLDIHHALYDAFSLEMLFRDLDAACVGKPLSDGLDFHSWVSHVETLDYLKPRKYWRELMKDSTMSNLVRHSSTSPHGHPLSEKIQVRVPLQNLKTPHGTPATALKAVWALLLANALDTRDVVFGEVSTNRYLPIPGLDEVRGPCVNLLPVRACLNQGVTLASLIAQLQDQSTTSQPHHHLGFRSIIKDCTDWPSWTRFSSIVTYQNHASLESSRKIGDSFCSFSGHGVLGASADISLIAMPRLEDVDIELRYSSYAFCSEQIRWISQTLVGIVQAIPDRNVSHLDAWLRDSLGPYPILPRLPSPGPNTMNGHRQHPSEQSLEVVSQAWREFGLLSMDQDVDGSMFSNGADIVTALLLSRYYMCCGYDISTIEVTQHHTRSMQASLVDLKGEGNIKI